MELKVNADFSINVNTVVDTEDPLIAPYSKEVIVQQAISQIMCDNYEQGDPNSEPTINWIECLECGHQEGLHDAICSYHDS